MWQYSLIFDFIMKNATYDLLHQFHNLQLEKYWFRVTDA